MNKISKYLITTSVLMTVLGIITLAISIATIFSTPEQNPMLLAAAAPGTGFGALGAGLASIGMIGTGVGQGFAAGKAAEAVGRNPEAEKKIRNMMIIGAAIAESAALYCFVIAIMALFVA